MSVPSQLSHDIHCFSPLLARSVSKASSQPLTDEQQLHTTHCSPSRYATLELKYYESPNLNSRKGTGARSRLVDTTTLLFRLDLTNTPQLCGPLFSHYSKVAKRQLTTCTTCIAPLACLRYMQVGTGGKHKSVDPIRYSCQS